MPARTMADPGEHASLHGRKQLISRFHVHGKVGAKFERARACGVRLEFEDTLSLGASIAHAAPRARLKTGAPLFACLPARFRSVGQDPGGGLRLL